jgi:hypothetical protein
MKRGKNMKKTYVFHEDPGHGWLAVKRKELVQLNLMNKISTCSYQNGDTVYLEEDCDAGLFIEKMKELNQEVEIRRSFRENTPIRSYRQFQK